MNLNFDMPADTIAGMRDAARDASIALARTFGFGGSQWYVDRPSGGGIAARLPVRQEGTVQALAFRQRPSALALSQAGQPTGDEIWRVIILDLASDVQMGDTLTSVADTGYQIQVDSLERWYDYRRGEVSEVRHG
jgi:hypothetical protein